MIRKLLFLLIFLVISLCVNAQRDYKFAGEFNYLQANTSVAGGTYRMVGFFTNTDQLGFTQDSIVNDSTYIMDITGNFYVVVWNDGLSPTTIEVDPLFGPPVAPTIGLCLIAKRSDNFGLIYETGGISDKMRALNLNRSLDILDSLINDVTVVGLDSIIAAAGISKTTVYAPSHGFSESVEPFLSSGVAPFGIEGNSIVAANVAAPFNRFKVGFVTDVISSDTLEIQMEGFIDSGHSLTTNQSYFLQADGSIGTTPDTILLEGDTLVANDFLFTTFSGGQLYLSGQRGYVEGFTDNTVDTSIVSSVVFDNGVGTLPNSAVGLIGPIDQSETDLYGQTGNEIFRIRLMDSLQFSADAFDFFSLGGGSIYQDFRLRTNSANVGFVMATSSNQFQFRLDALNNFSLANSSVADDFLVFNGTNETITFFDDWKLRNGQTPGSTVGDTTLLSFVGTGSDAEQVFIEIDSISWGDHAAYITTDGSGEFTLPNAYEGFAVTANRVFSVTGGSPIYTGVGVIEMRLTIPTPSTRTLITFVLVDPSTRAVIPNQSIYVSYIVRKT